MTISELFTFRHSFFQDLSRLMKELNENIALSEDSLKRMLDDPNSHLYTAQDDGRIVACASLCVFHQPWQSDGSVESLVVSSDFRGRGLGQKLVEHIISEAKRLGVDELHLTSRPSRAAANALYRRVGFKLKETNFYTLCISDIATPTSA